MGDFAFLNPVNFPANGAGIQKVFFGADTPLLGTELNEVQQLSEIQRQNFSKLIGTGFYVDTLSTATLTNNWAFPNLVVSFPEVCFSTGALAHAMQELADHENLYIYYDVVGEDGGLEEVDNLYPYGNLESSAITMYDGKNYMRDTRLGSESSRRVGIQFRLSNTLTGLSAYVTAGRIMDLGQRSGTSFVLSNQNFNTLKDNSTMLSQHLTAENPHSNMRTCDIFIAASDAPDAQMAGADYVCDGTADDVIINTALATLSAGGVVQFSTGTFYIADSIDVHSHTKLMGMGRFLTTFTAQLNGNVSAGLIDLGSSHTDISIEKICFINNLTYAFTATVNGTSISDLTIRDCYITTTQIAVNISTFSNGLIENCDIRTTGANCIKLYAVSNTKIINNTNLQAGTNGYAISFIATNNYAYISIIVTGNTLYGSVSFSTTGYTTATYTDTVISNNFISANGSAPAILFTSGYTGTDLWRVVITDNVVHSASYALSIDTVLGISIANNILVSAAYAGMQLIDVAYATIANNVIKGVAATAPVILNTVTYSTIMGNNSSKTGVEWNTATGYAYNIPVLAADLSVLNLI
jgi:hypothetical protein